MTAESHPLARTPDESERAYYQRVRRDLAYADPTYDFSDESSPVVRYAQGHIGVDELEQLLTADAVSGDVPEAASEAGESDA